jgi:hypothetical protein
VFENRFLSRTFGPKRDEVMGVLRKLGNETLHDLYTSPRASSIIKSSRMRWAQHVALVEDYKNAYRLLERKPEGKKTLGRQTWVSR